MCELYILIFMHVECDGVVNLVNVTLQTQNPLIFHCATLKTWKRLAWELQVGY